MNQSFKLPSLSHHAYVLVGGVASDSSTGTSDVRVGLLKTLEKTHKIIVHGNPDLFDRIYETFTIDDARELKASHEMKSVTAGAKKIFIMTMNGITIEAQNALLKLLEEPSDNAHFFLIIPSAHLLLPTIKSRVEVIYTIEEKVSASTDAVTFLKLPIQKRLDQIKKLTEEISKEKKTNQDAIDFVNALEAEIYKTAATSKRDATWQKRLKAIQTARTYLNDRAPSIKMLLEYVALNV